MTHLAAEDYAYNLQHTNPHGYSHFILPRGSLTVFLEEVRLKLLWLIRKQHFDITIPVAIIAIATIGSLIAMSSNKKDHGAYDFIKDGGAQIAAGTTIIFAMLSVHKTYHYNKRSAASKFIQQWCDEGMSTHKKVVHELTVSEFYRKHRTSFDLELFNRCHSIPAELKKSANGIEELEQAQSRILEKVKGSKEEYSVKAVLSLFEHMGQDVKEQVADSEYLKDYFYSTVIDYYEFFRKYIEFTQYDTSCRLRWCNFTYLAQTWEKEGFLPQLPEICYRPLVITESDIKQARRNRHHSIEEIKDFFPG